MSARVFAALGPCLAWLVYAANAHAEISVEACSNAYTRGQEERLAGRLYGARSEFNTCADAACPQAIAGDCKRWASEVEADLPSIRVQVRALSGKPIEQLSFSSDGVNIPVSQLAQPVILDAGPHTLHFEAPGFQALDIEKSLRPADRELEVKIVLRPLGAPVETETPARTPPAARTPPLAWVFAGAGSAALGVAVYFDLSSHLKYEDLKSSCAPVCSRADADSVHSRAVIGDVALLASAAAFGAAAWFYFSAKAERPHTALNLEARPGGARLGLRVAF